MSSSSSSGSSNNFSSQHVYPKQGGDIPKSEVTDLDILCGRGTKYCHHRGNKRYHMLVQVHCDAYKQAQSKDEKTNISRSIVNSLRNSTPPTRFIEKKITAEDGAEIWFEIGNKRAWEKTSQLLREIVSKGNHKTVYQKRKWDKELKRKSRKSQTREHFAPVSPPQTYRQQHSPTFGSTVSSAGSTRCSPPSMPGSVNSSFSSIHATSSPVLNAYSVSEAFTPSSRGTGSLRGALESVAHGLRDTSGPFVQNNSIAGGQLALPEREKYNTLPPPATQMPYPPHNLESPILGALSSMQASLNYLIMGSLNAQAAYMNPHQNNPQMPFSSVQRGDDRQYPGNLAWSQGYAHSNGAFGNRGLH